MFLNNLKYFPLFVPKLCMVYRLEFSHPWFFYFVQMSLGLLLLLLVLLFLSLPVFFSLVFGSTCDSVPSILESRDSSSLAN